MIIKSIHTILQLCNACKGNLECFYQPRVSNFFKALEVIVRATAVGQDAVLAGDPKVFRLLCDTNLNMIHT